MEAWGARRSRKKKLVVVWVCVCVGAGAMGEGGGGVLAEEWKGMPDSKLWNFLNAV